MKRTNTSDSVALEHTELLNLANKQFEEAAKQFKQVNHWRGLYNVYRNLELLSTTHYLYGTQVSQISSESTLSPRLGDSEEKRSENAELCKKYLDYFEVQRYSESINTNLTVQRVGGEDISLVSEVVLSCKNVELFEMPEDIVP